MASIELQPDVVVVGSGGPGVLAACAAADRGARVLLVEACRELGGTTAISGGQMWLPCNPQMHRAGLRDTRYDAATYLRRAVLGATPPEHIESFLDTAPALAEYLEADLGIALQVVDRPDYHPSWEGAARGRSLEPLPVHPGQLAALGLDVRVSPNRGPLTSTEARMGLPATTVHDRQQRGIRTQGYGLVTGLVKAAVSRGVQIATERRVVDLRRDGKGGGFRISAADAAAQLVTYRTRVVILANGGFSDNPMLRNDFLAPVEMIPTTPGCAMGDAIRLGLANGGHLRGMGEAWWTPATRVPSDGRAPARSLNLVRELAYPGSILVNRRGARFVDEASSYNDLTKSMLHFDAHDHDYPNARAWLIFDERFRRTFRVAGAAPELPAPTWFTSAPDLRTLADRLDIDPDGLRTTVAAMNDFASRGRDDDYGRGGNAHDAFNGDARHTPNGCLGPIETPPFYAVAVLPGANGTKGGLVTDAAGAVLDHDQHPIDGLFACGEAAAALMGPGYAGSGASLGPALTAALTIGRRLPLPAPSAASPDAGTREGTTHGAQTAHQKDLTP
jgi:succinate dehydrogenase/fumarate reductase flavoprotein subunit